MQKSISVFVLALLAALLLPGNAYPKSYPIIAYGTRTYVAETTESHGTILVRVYRRMGSSTWQRYGGFTLTASDFAARRAEVRRNPQAGSAPERVYFTGRVIGSTPFQPSSPLYRYRPWRRR
jgi:hypothetical protein